MPALSRDVSGTEPITEEAPSRAAERENAIIDRIPGKGLTPLVDVASPVPADIPHEDMVPPIPRPPRETSPEPPPKPEETSGAEADKGEDKGLVDKVRDFLSGEDRER